MFFNKYKEEIEDRDKIIEHLQFENKMMLKEITVLQEELKSRKKVIEDVASAINDLRY